MKKVINASSKTPVPQLASSIVHSLEDCSNLEVRAMGAGAVSQAYKAITVARSLIASKGKDLLIRPGFDVTKDRDDGSEKTVMVFGIVIN